MLKEKVHTGLGLTLVWAVALAFATAIVIKADETDFGHLYAQDPAPVAGAAASSRR